MEWRYRGMMDAKGVCTIREVFYQEDGTITSFAVDPAIPHGESPEDLKDNMLSMIECLEQPYLLEGDFIPSGESEEFDFTFIREDENKYH